jgi:sulfopyruvate decarboxylase alpha subunit
MNAAMNVAMNVNWPDRLFDAFKRADIRQVGYVPDAGHARLIERCQADPDIRAVPLTTEEEGIALAAGAWLGGERAALLMQSSGVGNCINMLSLARSCRFPLPIFITMRGEWEEFNPWQEPMGSIVEPVMKLCEADVLRVKEPGEAERAAERALQSAFGDERIVAVLLSQQLIGRKVWTK